MGDIPSIADQLPWSEDITPYDESHFVIYLRLLDAEAAGATVTDMAREILRIEPRTADQTRRIVESHLCRARWMTEKGYSRLVRP